MKPDVCEKSCRGSINRSRGLGQGHARRALSSAEEEREYMDYSESYATASCSKLPIGDQSHDVSHSGGYMQVSEEGRYHPAEKKAHVQNISSAVPLQNAKEWKYTETVMERRSTHPLFCKMETLPPRRLIESSVRSLVKDKMESASKSCSQPDVTSPTDDRRNKRFKLSTTSSVSSVDVIENRASRHCSDKQSASDVFKEGFSSSSIVAGKTELRRVKTEGQKTARSLVRQGGQHSQSDCAAGKQSQAVCLGSSPEVMEVSKNRQRSSGGHADSEPASVEKQYLQNKQDSYEPYSYNSSSQTGAKKSAKHKNKMKSAAKNVKSEEAEVKFSNDKRRDGENKIAESSRNASKYKNIGNSWKMDTENDVRSGGDYCRKDAHQKGQRLPHSVRDQQLSSSHMSVGIRRGKPMNYAENERNYNGSMFSVRSMHVSADYQHCHDSQEHSAKTDQCSSLKNSSEKACVSDDWEAELYEFAPSTHTVTDNGIDNVNSVRDVEEVDQMSMDNSHVTVGSENKTCNNNRLTTAEIAEEDHYNKHRSTTSGEVKMDNAGEQTQYKLYDAVTGEKNIMCTEASQAAAAGDTVKCSVVIGHVSGIPEYDAPTVSCSKPDMDTGYHELNDDRKLKVSVPNDPEYCVPSEDAEQCEHYSSSDEIIEPYEIGTNEFLHNVHIEKYSDDIYAGKLLIIVVLFLILFLVLASESRHIRG